jgi:aminoglycoside N3'-acetyltransferase
MGGDWTVMALGGSSHTYLHWGEYRVQQGAAGDQ